MPLALPAVSFGSSIDLSSIDLSGIDLSGIDVLEIAFAAATIGVWLLALAAVRMSTRPKDVDATPANSDFGGDEPPAVVSLLVNRWKLNEDAAESTLIDLAARGWYEFRQPGNDPMHTTVHLLPAPAGAPPLASYEQQVLDRVRHAAVDGVVPLTALTFRDPGEAHRFTTMLRASVIEDARTRGLSRRRIPPHAVGLLSTAAAAPAIVVGLIVAAQSGEIGPGFGAGAILFGLLTTLAARPMGERDTPAGQIAASKWLGLKGFLRNDDAFAELPPASVVVWDRYLSYGDALGVTRVCSALIDLGMGDRKRVWSAYIAGWHRVRISYPRFWHRYGRTAPHIARRAAYALVIGYVVLKGQPTFERGADGGVLVAQAVQTTIGWLIVSRAVYRLGRLVADLTVPHTLTGELLWTESWRTRQRNEDSPVVPVLEYFAVDDTGGTTTKAWALPSIWAPVATPGDIVTITVRPWTRRVTSVVVTSPRSARLAGAATASTATATGPVTPAVALPVTVPFLPAELVPALAPASAPGPVPAGGQRLLSVDEVVAALGRPVTSDAATGLMRLGPFELETFSDPHQGTPILVLAVAHGPARELVLRTARIGSPVSGIGDEAWTGPDWAIARYGDRVIRLNLERGATTSPGALTGLLGRAVSRLPQEAHTSTTAPTR